MDTIRKLAFSLPIALGLVFLGWFVYAGIRSLAYRDRQVVVRGLAEKEVMANKVTWPLMIKTVGNDLQQLYAEVNAKNSVVVKFLKDNGISNNEISIGAPQVFDKDAQTFKADAAYRYNATSVITVTSSKVELVNKLIKRQVDLLKSGVIVGSDNYEYKTTYEYTGLNSIKPAMIGEATRNARNAAAKFAEDSESQIGSIKTASQGQFSITDRDSYTPWIKSVRVVTTITYYLQEN